MEEDSIIALVPASQQIVLSPTLRHSFPSLPVNTSFTLMLKESPAIEQLETPETPDNNSKPVSYTLDTLSVILSALYCKLLIVLGLALPITKIITTTVPAEFYDFFYIYLYGGSLAFILTVHLISFKKKAVKKIQSKCSKNSHVKKNDKPATTNHYGSFYLRLGASSFGIGSMVYSGLELGEHFLVAGTACNNIIISAIKPVLRMAFALLQIHFIFLSDINVKKARFPSITRMCLGHMLATNIAEWLSVVVEETKHEIHHLHSIDKHHNDDVNHYNTQNCTNPTSGVLLSGATAYLFPCAIEYSLICAVTLIEMWKDVHIGPPIKTEEKPQKEIFPKQENKQYAVDCTNSENGLVGGLLINVYTLISLLVFFALHEKRQDAAYWCLTVCDTILNASSLLAIAIASFEMRNMAYCVHRFNTKGSLKLGLDISLLLKAQFGVYLYAVFSAIACYFTPEASIWPDLFTITQTSIQTLFILDSWWKRCLTPREQEKKPGRQSLTYLRLVNIAMWTTTITERNRAELRPLQLAFYGKWPWTIITHASMPLVVFYRFHSTICFFEVWRNAYKGIHTIPDTELMF
ncbi:unnamed protein product [Nezara viridula]|uniref:Uncharacterized protein n=1 Tax=Nezara viridula TaxID=85310 RepID=A0A9P0HL89_NEZVI|nr:unnamed protein product [Nezara viridula]